MTNSNEPSNLPREQLLDAAEKLFAQRGVHGASVRQITDAAGLRLASVNYYFKTKEGLFRAVLMRRAMFVVNERRSLLSNIDLVENSSAESITEIVKAIADPVYRRAQQGDSSWTAYISLIANIATTDLAVADESGMFDALDELSLEFINALTKVSSHGDERKAHHAFQFITGTVLYTVSNNGRINKLSKGLYRSDEYDEIYSDMIDYVSKGAIAILVT